MNRRRALWLSLGAAALLLLAGRALAGVYSDYRWYAALGASEVWGLRASSIVLLRLIAFSVATIVALANFVGVRHSVVSLVLPRQLGGIEIGEEVPGRALMTLTVTVSVLFGIAFAIPAGNWQGFDLARYGVRFDEVDPYVAADIGFYVYRLPFERSMYIWSVGVVAAISVIVVALYALTPSLKWQRGRIHVSTYVRRHLSLLAGAIIALLAWSFRLDAYNALTHGSGLDGTFSSFDHQLGVPIASILAYAAISAAFVVAWAGWTGQSRVAFVVMTILALLTPTMRYALPMAVQWASAPVNPDVRERSYVSNRNGFTRRAFGVDRITPIAAAEMFASPRDAAALSVWDPPVLARALERARRSGRIVGSPSLAPSPVGPVFVSVQESAPLRDDPGAGGWSLVRTLAAVTDERGGVVRVDEQGRFPLDDQRIPSVLVYEGAVGSTIVVDSTGTVAAPLMESFGARLSEAWSQQDFRLLDAPVTGARLVRRRDLRERLRALAPFFLQSTRIIPIVDGDSLLWSVELYSASADYPLSRKFTVAEREVAYFRHAATALVNPSSGRVSIAPDSAPDPIARTWMKLLPATLRPKTLAPSLAALLPPDVDGAEAQGQAFAAVGARLEASVDRRLPSNDGSDTLVRAHTPTFIWLPGANVSAWIEPVVDRTDHLGGLLIATGGAHRALRWLPVRDSTLAWGALLDRLQRVGASASTRPREQGVSGRVRVVPLTDGRVLAVQPFYVWPPQDAPYVTHVAVAFGDSSRAATSMAAAVGAPAPPGPIAASDDARDERMRILYAEMRAALEKSDWTAFGKAFDALGVLLRAR
ncbi:MAG TPA: UPF0182 family protein [Gemmatimonadaceae bacterium]|nr:UPF0182 family protein [Gemmatimonadaceae bacterium]